MTGQFQHGFEGLFPFVSWALPTDMERKIKRRSAATAQSKGFCDIILNLALATRAVLKPFNLARIAGADRTLLDVRLSLAECVTTIAMHEGPQAKYAIPAQRLEPTRYTGALADPYLRGLA